MSTDLTLKQALTDMETAWRRLREVLDGPDVAAALVGLHTPLNMVDAPRDGSMVKLHLCEGKPLKACWSTAYDCWVDESRNMIVTPLIIGWAPVK